MIVSSIVEELLNNVLKQGRRLSKQLDGRNYARTTARLDEGSL